MPDVWLSRFRKWLTAKQEALLIAVFGSSISLIGFIAISYIDKDFNLISAHSCVYTQYVKKGFTEYYIQLNQYKKEKEERTDLWKFIHYKRLEVMHGPCV